MKNNTWFITGVSGGFGKALAEELIHQGKQVVATFRKQEQAQAFELKYGSQVRAIILDVNNSNTIHEAVSASWNYFSGIDVVVNNAGYGLTGAIEEASEKEVRAQMETNFFGALFITQAFLPFFRIQGHGTFVQISSQAGISSTAGLGIYNSSKFALEGFSEALSKEASHLGIRVLIVEPGPFRTDWAGNSMVFANNEIAAYDSTSGVMRRRLNQLSGNQPGDPIKGAQAIISVVDADAIPLRLTLGKIAVDIVRAKIKQVEKDIEHFENISRSADF